MSTVIYIYEDGVLRNTFDGYPYYVLSMSNNSPTKRKQMEGRSFSDGQDILYSRYDDVIEDMTIAVVGATASGIMTALGDLQEVVNDVHWRANAYGKKMEIYVTLPDSAGSWRCTFKDMTIASIDERIREIEGKILVIDQTPYAFKYASMKIVFQRSYYWEKTTETELPLANSSGSGTGGRTIYNHDDSTTGHDNYVQLASNDAPTGIATPAKLVITNSHASLDAGDIYIGHTAFFGGSPARWLEGESGSLQTGVTSVAGSYSAGFAARCQHSSGEYKNIIWTLGATEQVPMRGRWFRLFLVITSDGKPANETWFKFKQCYGGAVLQETAYVRGYSTMPTVIDAGVLKFPPRDYKATLDPADLNLEFWSKSDSAQDFRLDAVMLMPAQDHDGLMYLKSNTGLLFYNSDILTIDGIDEVIYNKDYLNKYWPTYTLIGPWIMVQPGQGQLFNFIWPGDIAHTFSVRLIIRERRLML